MGDSVKRCSTCRVEKSTSEFAKRTKSRDGLQDRCRACFRVSTKAWRDAHPDYRPPSYRVGKRPTPEARFAARLKYMYGLEIAVYEAMLSAQGGLCAICAVEMSQPHVDHCHSTGKVRALLCNACNVGIGLLRENPIVIRAAAQYVETHS